MNSQLLIVLIACAALLLLGGCFMLLAVGVFIFLRTSGTDPEHVVDTARVQQRLPNRVAPPPVGPPVPPPPPPPLPPNLGMAIGEIEEEGAKTEVFQRSSMPMDWDADDEGEATEIFRADIHGDNSYKMD